MVTISFHQVAIATLSAALICGIIACTTKDFFVHHSPVKSLSFTYVCTADSTGLFNTDNVTVIRGLLISGLSAVALCLILEIASVTVPAARENKMIKPGCALLCFVAGILLVIPLAIAPNTEKFPIFGLYSALGRGSSFIMAVVSAVFTIESLVFYAIQWRCQ